MRQDPVPEEFFFPIPVGLLAMKWNQLLWARGTLTLSPWS